jgi:hypothetical protein
VSGFPEDWDASERPTPDSEQQQQSRECDLTRPFSAVSVLRACVAAGIVDSEETREAYERAAASLVERFGGGGGSDAEAADEATLRALDACFDAAEAERRAQRRDAAEEEGAVKEGAESESSSDGSDRPERSATEATSVGEYSASGAEAAAADSVYDAAEDPEVVAAEAAKAAKKEKAKAAKAAIAAKAKAANRAAKDASRGGEK